MAFIFINDIYAVIGQTVLVSGIMSVVLAKVVFDRDNAQPFVAVPMYKFPFPSSTAVWKGPSNPGTVCGV